MRTFIAITLPEEIKEKLKILQDKLKEAKADVSWVKPENIHITLKFLGEIDAQALEKISCVIKEVAKDKICFRARLSGLGAFPNTASPRVIWAGISEEDKFKEIAAVLEEKLSQIGIPKENRNFSCHATIGRVRSNSQLYQLGKALTGFKECFEKETLEFEVGKITLFKSSLESSGPIYEILKEEALIIS